MKTDETRQAETDPFVNPVPDTVDNVPKQWKKVVKFVEDNPEYELRWVFEWPQIGTVDSTIFDTYGQAAYILGPDLDLVIVPLIVERVE